MKKVYKLWLKLRGTVATVMMIACVVWALSALNFAAEDPDVEQLMGAGLLFLWVATKKAEWV